LLLFFSDFNLNKYYFEKNIINIYKSINDTSIDFKCFEYAIIGYQYLYKKNLVKSNYIVIVDYTQPSFNERLFLIDIKNKKLILKTKVAHGKNSGNIYPYSFSNIPNSNKSSIGFFITQDEYIGKHGYSLRLKGIEEGINDNAMDRGIIIHGANYVSNDYVKKYGRIGRSNGCLAVPVEINEKLIKIIKSGTCVFIYYPEKEYFNKSKIILNKNHFKSL